jgi:outer membrane protein assembly factor BamA
MRDHFIPSFSYTFTYASPSKHRHPVWFQANVKEAGNLTSSIYALCGKPFSQEDKKLFGNPFAQYIKASAELHHTFHIPRTPLSLAWRVFAGAIYSYGNSRMAPYADLFYVGGANSVRGFTVRTIGPGGYKSADTKYAYVDQTGDVKLEANLEFRFPIVADLHGAAFLDAGNVWLLRPDQQRPGAELNLQNLKKIAVGTGLGLRYDLDFLVLRFDVGVGLHAPYDTGKSGWYNMPKFGRSLAYHLAIGYPF